MKYEALYNLTLEQGGATIRVKDYPDQIAMPTKGFAVGGAGNSFEVALDDKEGFDVSIDRALKYNQVFIGAEHLGTWVHAGEIIIDLVNVFASKEFALGVAFERGELAIYDLAEGKEITIKRKKGK